MKTAYSIRSKIDGQFYCAEKSYCRPLTDEKGDTILDGQFNGMWIVGDGFYQLLGPGFYEIVEI